MLADRRVADGLRSRRYLCPHKHCAFGFIDFPTGAIQTFDQTVSALLVHQANLFHAILRPVERLNGRDLDRLKNAIIKVTFDPRQGVDDVPITDRKSDPPTRHVIAFRKREKFDSAFLSARHLEKARRLVAIEGNIGISQIVDNDKLVLLRKFNDALEEVQLHNRRCRIVRKTNNQQFGLWPGLFDRLFKVTEKTVAIAERNTSQITAGENHCVLMDRVSWAGAEHYIARIHQYAM